MSPAANKPDHTSHGETRHTQHNIWTKDTKIKTAKCRLCNKRVDLWSWQCNRCTERICSRCCQDDITGVDYNKQSAKDMIEHGCWCRRFIGGFNPKLKHLKSKLPVKQEEQMAKDAAAKKKAMETNAKKKAAERGIADPGEGSLRRPTERQQSTEEASAEQGESEVSDYMEPGYSPTLHPRTELRRYGEAANEEQDSGSEIFDPFQSTEASSKRRGGTAAVVDDEEYREESEASPSAQWQQGKQTKAASYSKAAGALDFSLPRGFVNPFKPKEQRDKEQKRKADAARLGTDGKQTSLSGKAKKAKKTESISPLEEGHTLVVGAGIIGLFTAYELATRCNADRISHAVTVVEIRNRPCELASGQCAGFISSRGIPRSTKWIPLLYDAQEAWKVILRRVEPSNVGFVGDKMYFAEDIDEGDDEGEPMPAWFKPGPIHCVTPDDKASGRVNTRRLARWLYQQCGSLNINFFFGRAPEAVQRNPGGSGYQVSIGDPNQPFQNSTTIDCSHIVLAAGPFTTFIADHVFNNSERTGLSNRYSECFWLETQLNYTQPGHEVGITVETTDNWSDGNMTMVLRPGASCVEVSAAEKLMTAANVNTVEALKPPAMVTTPLQNFAGDYLGVRNAQTLHVSNSGGATISVAKGRAPYVDLLRVRSADGGPDVEMPKVWLSYGFGRFGTTLAPGAAQTVVDMMMQSA